jgi:hypothetical protein
MINVGYNSIVSYFHIQYFSNRAYIRIDARFFEVAKVLKTAEA